jgi:hypothetical protein
MTRLPRKPREHVKHFDAALGDLIQPAPLAGDSWRVHLVALASPDRG